MTSLYVVVIGIALVILFPLYFLIIISLMSDFEAYRWPLSAAPSFSVTLRIYATDEGYRMRVFDRNEKGYLPFGPVSFTDSN